MALEFWDKTRRIRFIGTSAVGIAIALTVGCSAETEIAEGTSSTSATTTPVPSSAAPSNSTSAATATGADLKVCAAPDGLETRGMPFSKTYTEVLNEGGTADGITVGDFREQLLALTTIGAPAGLADGSDAINAASFDVRQAMSLLAKDAKDLLPRVSAQLPQDGLTDVMYSFTQAIGACKQAGYLVSWMKATP